MNVEEEVKILKKKAANADKSEDALRFSQAALNLIHVEAVFLNNQKEK